MCFAVSLSDSRGEMNRGTMMLNVWLPYPVKSLRDAVHVEVVDQHLARQHDAAQAADAHRPSSPSTLSESTSSVRVVSV